MMIVIWIFWLNCLAILQIYSANDILTCNDVSLTNASRNGRKLSFTEFGNSANN